MKPTEPSPAVVQTIRPSAETPRRRFSWPLALVACVFILAVLAGFVFYQLETLPLRAARQVQEVLGAILHVQPRITVADRVLFEQATTLLELAVVTRETQVEHEKTEVWLGSTKRLKLRGMYRVRSGFDLTKPFSVKVEGKKILVEVPPPKVLSVETVETEVLDHENGVWNKVRPDEVAAELQQMPAEALRKAKERGVNREALEFLQRQLVERFGAAYQVEVRVHHEAAGATPMG